jgi:hypothetical protein
MPKTKIADQDAVLLDRHDKRVTELEGRIRSSDKNVESYNDFLAEADAMIALPALSEKERDVWKARKLHCETVQMAEASNQKAAAEALLVPSRAALASETAKLAVEKGSDGWYTKE